jgi:hypothetical protein
MGRPSDPLLKLIRDLARKKGMNTAALAVDTGIDRARLKHVLGGAESMTVDELLLVANALHIDARTLGMIEGDGAAGEDDEGTEPSTADVPLSRAAAPRSGNRGLAMKGGHDSDPTEEADRPRLADDRAAPWLVDPFGNHAEQALRLGFGLGCNLFLWLESAQLEGTGVPPEVVQSQGDTLRIQLDAAYHRHNKPVFQDDHLQLILSFGTTLHTVRLPWAAFRQVALIPLPPRPDVGEEPPEPKGPGRGHLRLVE